MANIERLVIEWLETVVGEDWPVYGDKPRDLPEKFILIDRTGGDREAMVLDRAEILIEVYHKTSRMIASDKANSIADFIPYMDQHDDNITKAKVNSVVNLPDVISQSQRYQVYCDVNYRR